MIKISVVIPVFNEEKRLPKTFSALVELSKDPFCSGAEIIFVDDGSRDGTRKLIENFRSGKNVKLVSYEKNRGKGFAVRQGMMAADNDYALFLDADMSTPLGELKKFAPFMERGAHVIIGTRKTAGAKILKHQPYLRQKMGEVYTALANLATGARVSDFTCGFKCFSREAVRGIFPHMKIDRWSYDAEILYLATLRNLKIHEVPVSWSNDADSRVRLGKDALQSFTDLLKIRLNKYPGVKTV